ncbi:Lipase [Folsomia candida]|uniref:Lipase n=1 Tax=Folsomia candida TaxID=158441 RepID=A0A226D6X8_FOLCA|nr:Lipase [Folsomia candida]
MGEPGPSSTRLGLSGLVIAFRLVQKFPSWAGRVRVGSDRTWKTLESGTKTFKSETGTKFGDFYDPKLRQKRSGQETRKSGSVEKFTTNLKEKACQAFPFSIYGACSTSHSDKNTKPNTKGSSNSERIMNVQLTRNFSNVFGSITNLLNSPAYDYSRRPTKISRNVLMTIQDLQYYNYFSFAMYCPTTLETLTCPYCQHFNETVTEFEIFYNEIYATKGMVTLHGELDEIVVVFRGTVVQKVGTLLAQNPGFRVVVTGHSLGAAMASLFVYLMTSLDQFPDTNYVLITADKVPHIQIIPKYVLGMLNLPTGIMYVHHGQEVWLSDNEIYYCSKQVYEDPDCSNSVGRNYHLLDHLHFFDVNYSLCIFVEGWLNVDLLTVPGLFTPTNFIPPVPTFMKGILTGIVEGGYQGLLPVVG